MTISAPTFILLVLLGSHTHVNVSAARWSEAELKAQCQWSNFQNIQIPHECDPILGKDNIDTLNDELKGIRAACVNIESLGATMLPPVCEQLLHQEN